MQQRILVALAPGSQASEVLQAAVDIAAETGGTLSALRVVEGAGESPESQHTLVSAARAELRELIGGVPVSWIDGLHTPTGTAWRQICDAARAGDDQLVVIGAHRRGRFEGTLGATAANVVNHCARSVLVVRGWRRSPRRMLVAVDASERARIVRDYAVALARRGRGKLRLFHGCDLSSLVQADVPLQYSTLEAALRDAAGEALGAHERAVPLDLRDGLSAGLAAEAWREICAVGRQYDADLVVIGSRAYGSADRVLGSTASLVVDHADRSVLVVRHPWRG
jgi:nucleotide-binding universal stress UspA family protein